MKTNVTYPDGCNESTKQFVDKINEILNEMKGIVLDEFYLGQNGVYSTIYKIVLPNYFIATIECFDDEGTYMFNIKEHYEKVKVVKYNHMLNPINTYTLPFHGIDSVKICIDFLSNKK